jgi:uncharacterized protein (TIGR03435 family)
MRALLPAVTVSLLALPAFAQDRSGPEFEVASVKRAAPLAGTGVQRGIWSPDPNRVTGRYATLGEMIRYAFNVRPYQVVGPAWLEEERYDVEARAAASSTPDQFRAMLQSLLAARFALAVHHEHKDMTVYEMTVAKGGPKMPEAKDLTDGNPPPGREYNTLTVGTAAGLARVLSNRNPGEPPIIDRTGLTATYRFAISLEPGQDLASALQEQLGLKLTPKKVPTEILVVDRAEKIPAGN